jgi:hypothetical protein
MLLSRGSLAAASAFALLASIDPGRIALGQPVGWQDQFAPPVDGYLQSIAVGNAGVYVGGEFTSIAGVVTANIALWNGSSWSSLGAGANGPVRVVKLDAAGNLVMR